MPFLFDSIPFGAINAANHVPIIGLHLDQDIPTEPHYPTEPHIPPNPIFPAAVPHLIHDQLFTLDAVSLIGVNDQSDWLLG